LGAPAPARLPGVEAGDRAPSAGAGLLLRQQVDEGGGGPDVLAQQRADPEGVGNAAHHAALVLDEQAGIEPVPTVLGQLEAVLDGQRLEPRRLSAAGGAVPFAFDRRRPPVVDAVLEFGHHAALARTRAVPVDAVAELGVELELAGLDDG